MSGKLAYVLAELDALERSAEAQSPLHRIDARAKLLLTVGFLTTMLSVPLTRLSELLLYFLFPIVGGAAGGLRYGPLFRRSLIVLPLVAFIGVFNLLYDREPALGIGPLVLTRGWITFLSIVVRGLLSVQALLLLIATTGYYRLCRSMQRLGVPSVFTTQLLFVYRYTYVLIREALQLTRARDARSFGRRAYPLRTWGTLVGQLLVRTFNRAELIGRAMLARGFTGRIPEGLGMQTAWRTRDTAFLAAGSTALLLLRLYHPVESLASLIAPRL
ncbi:cobalt ECF transporter T component CbiQ [Alistipes sp.]|uniref:cobalt ECF transporter T component CbiQ n=1 Tax=Alistipes sp. TaxID=1872444 RepID=UPI003AEF4472